MLYAYVEFFVLTGQRGPRRARAPTLAFWQSTSTAAPTESASNPSPALAFRQPASSDGSALRVVLDKGARGQSVAPVESAPVADCTKDVPRSSSPVPTVRSVGESSRDAVEETLSKRQRVTLEETPSRDVPLRASPAGMVSEGVNEAVQGAEVSPEPRVEGTMMTPRQDLAATTIIQSGSSLSQQALTPPLVDEILKGMVVDDYESDSDINPEDM